MRIEGARVLLTGATGGIGRAIAAEIAARGGHLLLSARDESRLSELAATHATDDRRSEGVSADLRDSAERAYLAEVARRWEGGIDAVVHCAGASSFACFEDQSESELVRLVMVDLVAPMLLTRALLPHLRTRPAAQVVSIGSILGHIGHPGFAAYGAAKAALASLSEALHREHADGPVRFLYIAPRATRTSMNGDAVYEMNRELGVACDPPELVASEVCRAMASDRPRTLLGWPEKLFVRINALFPRLVDGDFARKLPAIRRFADRKPRPTP